MKKENYLKDISEIKSLMTKSSKFSSLSGKSGVFTGVYALIGAIYYYYTAQKIGVSVLTFKDELLVTATIIFSLVVICSVLTSVYFTSKRSNITNEKLWDAPSKMMLHSFFTIITIGAIFLITLYFKEDYKYLLSLIFLFYGLALMYAAKHTKNVVTPLAITQIISGLLCAIFNEYGFWFWTIGFGWVHVFYAKIVNLRIDKTIH